MVRVAGEVTREKFASLLETVYRDHYSPKRFLDLSAASLLQISQDDILFLIGSAVALEKERFPDGVDQPLMVAFFAPQDLNYGVARMWQAMTESYRKDATYGVFRSEEEAMAWLLNPENTAGEALEAC